MTTLNSQLQLALLNRKQGRNLLEKGFTLVELMIVIVIVGILSAVALPNFLNQTLKAKATEAKSQMAAMFKNGASSYVEGSIAEASNVCETAPGPDTLFSYECTGTLPIILIKATGRADVDPALNGKTLVGCVNLEEGLTKIDKELDAETPVAASECTVTASAPASAPASEQEAG